MKSRLEKPTQLASKITSILLTNKEVTPPDFVCMSTGETIRGRCKYHVMLTLNPNAQGPYYLAYGYYYIFCLWRSTQTKYVAVHKASNSKFKGWMTKADAFEVFISAET